MSTNAEINDFIIKHADAKYFEADVKLYKKHFPNSRLIPELERAPDFAKKNLDERILSELLTNQDSCIDCIWENRGYIRDNGKVVTMTAKKEPAKKQEEKKAPKNPDKKEVTLNMVLKTDLNSAKYNVLKQMVFDLGLQKQCKDQKKATYLKALQDYLASPKTDSKKKEAPGKNTQE